MISKGIYYAVLTAIISGTAIFVNKIFISSFDPVLYTSLKNSLVALVFFSALLFAKKIKKISALKKGEITKLFLIGILGGGLPFAMFFTGLKEVNAVTASFIHKTLFIWVSLLAVPLLKEKLSKTGVLSILFLAIAINLNLKVENLAFVKGNLLILGATLLWAIENIVVKKVLKTVDVDLVAFSRMSIGSICLILILGASDKLHLSPTFNPSQVVTTLLSSGLLFFYVATWYRALKYAPITLVANILAGGIVVTNLLSVAFVGQKISNPELISNLLIISAITIFIKVHSSYPGLQPDKTKNKPRPE
jgi:drug/metabolite transporter (DMT)-like permease